jgi:hypothetical protein
MWLEVRWGLCARMGNIVISNRNAISRIKIRRITEIMEILGLFPESLGFCLAIALNSKQL